MFFKRWTSLQPKIEETDQIYQWVVSLRLLYFSCFSTCPEISQVQTSTRLFQRIGNVYSDNTLSNVENLLSTYNSTSCSCADCYIFYFIEQCFIQQIRSSSLFKSRASNFALGFPRVYRGPIEVILGIFGRKFFDRWRIL